MRLLSIDNVQENMLLARNIYSAEGYVLLAEGVKISGQYIRKLKELGINSLYITDNQIGKIEVDDLVRLQTRIEAVKIVKETLVLVRDNQSVSGEKLAKVVNNIIDEIIRNRKISYNLMDTRAMSDYLFNHCLAVCVLAVMTGILMGYNYQRLKELGIGAILHDLGKVCIPEQLLNKCDQLSQEEFEEIKKHSQLGYDILKKCNDISSVSAIIAWEHHERMDGSGYSRKLKGNEIHEFARITAIADVYDALSTDRAYRGRFFSQEVIEFLRDGDKGKFDQELMKLFLQNVVPFPIGTMVLLNNGEKGLVIKVPKDFPARPTVKVLYDEKNVLLTIPFDRDLKNDLTLFIIKSLKDDEV